MRYSVNVQCLLPGMSFAQALAYLSQRGFDTVEDWTVDRAQVAPRAQQLQAWSMKLSAFCPAFFTLNDEACHDRYAQSLREALEDAAVLSCPALITQVGADTGARREAQHTAIVAGLRRVAPMLEQAGVCLLVEPLNDVKDHPGYYLTSSEEGFAIIREVASPNVKLLFDVYHQVHMGEDVLRQIANHIDSIGHFHIAAHPGRNERIFEGFDYAAVLRLIKETGTQAPVGIELFPSTQEAADALLTQLNAFL